MGAKFEIGRIAGLPIFIDVSFIVLVVLWGGQYFTSGSTILMSMGYADHNAHIRFAITAATLKLLARL